MELCSEVLESNQTFVLIGEDILQVEGKLDQGKISQGQPAHQPILVSLEISKIGQFGLYTLLPCFVL